jgi:DET1- and DDB1-associated protein 1
MSIADALKDLPSKNKEHFSRLNIETHNRSTNSRKSTYLTTKDIPPEQKIVTERENMLLRYLHQQWDKKTNAMKKRQGDSGSQDEPAEKKPKLEQTLTSLTSASPASASGQTTNRILPGYSAGSSRSQGASRTNITSRPPAGGGAANSGANTSSGGQSRSSVLYFN